MESFSEILYYIFYILVAIYAFWSFGYGIKLILTINEITIGKASSQFLAVIIALTAFYRIDTIPLIEEIAPLLIIENSFFIWVFKLLFSLGVLLCLFRLYENWRSEIDKIKEDAQILFILLLFATSGLAFGFIV